MTIHLKMWFFFSISDIFRYELKQTENYLYHIYLLLLYDVIYLTNRIISYSAFQYLRN